MQRLSLFLTVLITTVSTLSAQPPQQRERRPWPPFDAQNPDVHDPVMAWEGDSCYIFATGMGIQVMASADMKTWHRSQSVFREAPAWAVETVHGYRGHTWAPDIVRRDSLWYLYYSCSTFGRNRSAIGVAVSPTLNAASPDYGWTDLGQVIASRPLLDDFNAIDPNVCFDADGRPWLTFGSFWDGIQLVQLDSDMKTPIGSPKTIARRQNPEAVRSHTVQANDNAVEAPFIIYHDGYYYLFVSFDLCCKGLNSTYKTAVGRSKKISGPFRDRQGKKMTKGGGTILIGQTDRYAGVGHCAAYEHNGQWFFLGHGYDKQQNGMSKLVLRPMIFEDGWPVIQ